MAKKYASLISQGLVQDLQVVPYHGNGAAPLTRRVMAGGEVHPVAQRHVVVHEVRDVPSSQRDYCEPHVHDCPEINMFLTLSRLVYKITLGEEEYVVEAPATIFIPAGLPHSANVMEGNGFYVAIVDTNHYASSVSASAA